MDSKEKDALLYMGFFSFVRNDFEEAKKHWMAGSNLDADQVELQKKRFPNLGGRLCGAADQKFFCALPEEIKNLSPLMRLKINYAEMLYVQEKFEDSFAVYEKLLKKRESYDANTLAVILGNAGDTLKIATVDGSNKSLLYYQQIMNDPKLSKTPTVPRVMFYCAESYHQSDKPELNKKSIPLYLECAEKNKKSKVGELSLYKAAILLGVAERYDEAADVVKTLKRRYPESEAAHRVEKIIEENKQEHEKYKKLNAERMKQNEERRKQRMEAAKKKKEGVGK